MPGSGQIGKTQLFRSNVHLVVVVVGFSPRRLPLRVRPPVVAHVAAAVSPSDAASVQYRNAERLPWAFVSRALTHPFVYLLLVCLLIDQ